MQEYFENLVQEAKTMMLYLEKVRKDKKEWFEPNSISELSEQEYDQVFLYSALVNDAQAMFMKIATVVEIGNNIGSELDTASVSEVQGLGNFLSEHSRDDMYTYRDEEGNYHLREEKYTQEVRDNFKEQLDKQLKGNEGIQ